MTARDRTRSFLAYGFAISLAVHAFLLPFVHAPSAQAYDEPSPDLLKHDPMPSPPPLPPPPPTPAAQRTQPPRETPRVRTLPVRVVPPQVEVRHGGRGVPSAPGAGEPSALSDGPAPAAPGEREGAVPPPAPEPTPQPAPTPLWCTRPDIPPATVRAAAPDMPVLALQQGISGTVAVIVSLDTQSRIVATRIGSSPSALLNGPALAAARASQFTTEVKDCAPRAAEYIFSVEFTSG